MDFLADVCHTDEAEIQPGHAVILKTKMSYYLSRNELIIRYLADSRQVVNIYEYNSLVDKNIKNVRK